MIVYRLVYNVWCRHHYDADAGEADAASDDQNEMPAPNTAYCVCPRLCTCTYCIINLTTLPVYTRLGGGDCTPQLVVCGACTRIVIIIIVIIVRRVDAKQVSRIQ